MITSAGIFQKSGFTERFSMRWSEGAAILRKMGNVMDIVKK
jgi:hypothetical protein